MGHWRDSLDGKVLALLHKDTSWVFSTHVKNLGVFEHVYNSKLEGTNWNISGACKQVNLLNW